MNNFRIPKITEIKKAAISAIERINQIAVSLKGKKGEETLMHLSNAYELYSYIYYSHIVDKTLNGSNGKIVDFGGFYGQVTVLLISMGYDCENYCLYRPRHANAFAEFKIPFKINKINPSKLPYKDNSCIAVISSGVLEHVHQEGASQEIIMKEIFRILKPGGYFFCWNLPRKYALVEFLARLHNTSCHDILFTKKDLTKLLSGAGLKTIAVNMHSDILKIKGLRNVLYLFKPWTAFLIDYYVSKIPFINFFAHHITVIAQK